jgi:predicted PurR-regulated permease PerM
LIYQHFAYDWYWELMAQPAPLDDADKYAGAMMSIGLAVQMIIAVGVGSIVGLACAGISLKRNPRFFSFGAVALLFNLFPFLGVIILFLNRGT